MTIKGKLTLNVVIVLVVVGAVAVTSMVSMGFVKNKLFYLTERSTPYQMKTIELQRSMQGAAASLVKLSASRNLDDYNKNRAEAERSMSDVENSQNAIKALSDNAVIEVYDELEKTAAEMFETIKEKLNAEGDAFAANKTILQKLNDAVSRLKELDSKIKDLHHNRSTTFSASLEDTKGISSKLRDIELLMTGLKDIQLIVNEINNAADRKALIIARGKVNAAVSKALLNEYLRETKAIYNEIKSIEENTDEIAKLRLALIKETDADAKNRFDELNKNLNEKLTSVLLSIEQEALSAREKFGMETRKQGNTFIQANIATNILISNSELVGFGLSIEGLTTRLFTHTSIKELDSVESEITKIYERINPAQDFLEKQLVKLEAKDEMKILQNAKGALSSVRGLLFAQDGVTAKLRRKLNMDEKALLATEKLREMVQQQAEKGRETVTLAQGEQETAIKTVNKMVGFSTKLTVAIGIAAVIFGIGFGIWVYKSISHPLTNLIQISDDVASGNLSSEISAKTRDELGTVQSSMSKMVVNLRDVVGKIMSATENLASSSMELSATAVSLEKGSGEQVKLVEQSVTAITQMSQATTDVSRNTANTAEAAQLMKKAAIQGKETTNVTVRELVSFMDRFRDSVSRIESLGNKSEEITNIVSLIKGIAEQTNLLALNAAIEAARAGEVGRGFAIVADNVRELAERTSSAAADIAHNVVSMKTEIAESVSYMKSERDNVGAVLNNIKNTSTAIDEIVRNVENVTDMVQRIATAAEEQSAVSGEVNRNVEDISSVTRELDNSVTGIKSSSEDLSRLAVELNSMAGWFKVQA